MKIPRHNRGIFRLRGDFELLFKKAIFDPLLVYCNVFLVGHLMEDSTRITYEPPLTEIIEIQSEGIVCASGEAPDMEHGWDLVF